MTAQIPLSFAGEGFSAVQIAAPYPAPNRFLGRSLLIATMRRLPRRCAARHDSLRELFSFAAQRRLDETEIELRRDAKDHLFGGFQLLEYIPDSAAENPTGRLVLRKPANDTNCTMRMA